MFNFSLEDVKAYAQKEEYQVLPVCLEILSDVKTPIEVLIIIKQQSEHCFLLESVSEHEKWGRYTFLGYDPRLSVTCNNGLLTIGDRTIKTNDPAYYIRQLLKDYKSPQLAGLPPFTGGLMGYFSYDYIKYSEPSLIIDAPDTDGFNDIDLMLFDKLIAFDNYRQKILLIYNIKLADYENQYEQACRILEDMAAMIQSSCPGQHAGSKLTSEIKALFSREQYCEMVRRAKHHIHEGDIFQIVLSNRFEAAFTGSLLNTYRILRTINPSPYMFYLSGTDIEVAGASPETLVKLQSGVLYTYPLAGTRPRGRTEEEDLALEKELLNDEKELAEHNMLVDLSRNDIGRISSFGSVEVEKYHEILRFSHVMHIGSTVRGQLAEQKDSMDAIASILPAGTLSGAPKIRACQLIDTLEKNKRGIYGGAIGYLDFAGNLDTCIAIRIAYKKNGKVFIRSGAGIVADSVPEAEYDECLNKAAAVVKALKMAEEVEV